MNYYALLGIPEEADATAIHNAFRSRARRYHPDAGEGSCPGKFREIVEAYETLSDPARRCGYDQTLRNQTALPPRTTMHEVVVEPLAQDWFSARPIREMNTGGMGVWAIEQLFEDIFRFVGRDFFEDWF